MGIVPSSESGITPSLQKELDRITRYRNLSVTKNNVLQIERLYRSFITRKIFLKEISFLRVTNIRFVQQFFYNGIRFSLLKRLSFTYCKGLDDVFNDISDFTFVNTKNEKKVSQGFPASITAQFKLLESFSIVGCGVKNERILEYFLKPLTKNYIDLKRSKTKSKEGLLNSTEEKSITGNVKKEKSKGLNLDIRGNFFRKFPAIILDLKCLSRLNIMCMNFSELPVEIGKLHNLTYLNFSENKITSFTNEHVQDLNKLSILYGFKNRISKFASKFPKSLEDIDFSMNLIEEIPDFSDHERIVVISFCYNKIRTIGKKVKDLIHLNKLYLSHNEITEISLEGCISILSLDLTCNKLKKITGLSDLKLLEEIYVGDNELSNDVLIELGGKGKRLFKLFAGFNKIDKFANELCELKGLAYLDLSGNAIKDVPNDLTNIFQRLRVCYLSDNKIPLFKRFWKIFPRPKLEPSNVKKKKNSVEMAREMFFGIQRNKSIDISFWGNGNEEEMDLLRMEMQKELGKGQKLYKIGVDLHNEIEGKSHKDISFGVCDVKGPYRMQQEDATCCCSLKKEVDFFGVFDGHGGKVTSNICGRQLPLILNGLLEKVNLNIFINSQDTKENPKSKSKNVTKVEKFITIEEEKDFNGKQEKDGEVFIASDGIEKDDNINNKDGKLKKAFLKEEENRMDEHVKKTFTKLINKAIEDLTTHLINENVQDGTCFTGVLFYKDYIITTNIGDSRVILCNKNGKIFQLTEDHRPFTEFNRLRKSGDVIINSRVNGIIGCSRSLGDFNQKLSNLVDIKFFRLSKLNPKWIVIGCDGVFDFTTNERVMKNVEESLKRWNGNCYYAAVRLCNLALSSNSRDNVSVCVIKFN